MNPNKALWEKGDFTRIAATMRESGEALVNSFGITRGLRSWTSDAAMERPHSGGRLGADVLGVILREILSRPATGAQANGASPMQVPRRRCHKLARTRRS